jgi:chemotaxis methyl-accepting protein methylase
LDQGPSEWLEIWNLVAAGEEKGFFRYAAQLETLGRLIKEGAPFAPTRSLKILSLGASDGREAASVAMVLANLGLKEKGWKLAIYGLELSPKLVAAARSGLYTSEALDHAPWPLARRFFRPRAGGWLFQANFGTIKFENLNPHLLEDPPDYLMGADAVLARGLAWETPDEGFLAFTQRLRPVFNDHCLVMTGPGEFWPELSDFNLEVREGVTYYRREGKRLGPKAGKKPFSLAPAPSPTPPLKSLFWLAEEKLAQDPEAAREIATELIHEEALLGYLNPVSLELILKAEAALGRSRVAAATAEVIGSLIGA